LAQPLHVIGRRTATTTVDTAPATRLLKSPQVGETGFIED